jgi:hypothetical protein
MRRLLRPRLLTERSPADSFSKERCQRCLFLGRSGGNSARCWLSTAQELEVANEGQLAGL